MHRNRKDNPDLHATYKSLSKITYNAHETFDAIYIYNMHGLAWAYLEIPEDFSYSATGTPVLDMTAHYQDYTTM